MTTAGWLQFGSLIALLTISTPLLGAYLASVYEPSGASASARVFRPIERAIYRCCGVDESTEQRWPSYARSLLALSAVAVLVLYGIQRLQGHLPLDPDHHPGVPPALAWNTAVSFVTNTNWQNYAGESVMAHLTQMAGLAVQNFVSAAVGASVAVALIRGLVRRGSETIGNFWVDVVRTCVRVLLPLACVVAVFLLSQGVVEDFHGARTVVTVEGAAQVIPSGPVASQEAIKEVGQNGGGFFNANSAHPYENPSPLTNLVEVWALLALPFGFAWAFGRMVGDRRQGAVVLAVMAVLWVGTSVFAMTAESSGSPAQNAAGASQGATGSQPGGNLEGKELRFGSAACGLFAASTTSTSAGAVDCAHDSMTALGGGAALAAMMFGEVSPGGTGSGLYGMLVFALLAVFIAGLMVGRTPEYLGKKIQEAEMKLVVLYLLAVPIVVLCLAAISIGMGAAVHRLGNPGPHGLTEMVYAFTSAGNNNGSAFGGLGGDTDWFNGALGVAMLVGRYFLMVPVLALAGSLARKHAVPPSSGTMPTGTVLFGGLLLGVVVIVVGLTYFPVLALGPVVEHLAS